MGLLVLYWVYNPSIYLKKAEENHDTLMVLGILAYI